MRGNILYCISKLNPTYNPTLIYQVSLSVLCAGLTAIKLNLVRAESFYMSTQEKQGVEAAVDTSTESCRRGN